MNWHHLTSIEEVDVLIDRSRVTPCLILKHSTRCPISSMAKNRLEMTWDEDNDGVETYFLDLIRYRDVSDYIASVFAVQHESPQALLIKNGDCIRSSSHLNIRADELQTVS